MSNKMSTHSAQQNYRPVLAGRGGFTLIELLIAMAILAFGMLAAARISDKMGILDKKKLSRIKSVIKKADLPTEMPNLEIEKVIQAMKHDKKVQQDKIRFVLLKSIGSVFITDEVSLSLVREVLTYE